MNKFTNYSENKINISIYLDLMIIICYNFLKF
jgi:hypothetical protein